MTNCNYGCPTDPQTSPGPYLTCLFWSRCPDNTYVSYVTTTKAVLPTDPGYMKQFQGLDNREIWNYNILPAYKPGSYYYFGLCECLPGYKRQGNSEAWKLACVECTQGHYCMNGTQTACAASWYTAGTTASSPQDCNVCHPGGCGVGSYCDPSVTSKHNTEGGVSTNPLFTLSRA